MNKQTCSIDYFGIAGAKLVEELLNQSSNNRKRKVAFNNLVRLAKATGLVPKDQEIWFLGYELNRAGEPVLFFLTQEKK